MRDMPGNFFPIVLISLMIVAAVGCDGSSGGTSPSTIINGTAAAGAPINGTVYVIGSNGGTPTSSAIDSNGHFSVDVKGMQPPYILWAVGDIGGKIAKFYSLHDSQLGSRNIANITPATHLAMADALDALPQEFIAQSGATLPSDMAERFAESAEELNQFLSNTIADLAPGATDLTSVDFVADSSGVDAIYDVVDFAVEKSGANIILTLRDKATAKPLQARNATDAPATRSLRAMTQAEIDATLADSLAIKNGIEDAWKRLLDPFKDLEPMQKPKELAEPMRSQILGQITTAFSENAAPDLMEDGLGYNEEIRRWYGDEFREEVTGPVGRLTLLGVSIVRPMGKVMIDGAEVWEYDPSKYDKGMWVRAITSLNDGNETLVQTNGNPDAFVREIGTGKWLLYGNRVGLAFTEVQPAASRTIERTGTTDRSYYNIGLEYRNDYTLAKDIKLICVVGPGIEANVFNHNANSYGPANFPTEISYTNATGETVTYTRGLSFIHITGRDTYSPYNVAWSGGGNLRLDESLGLDLAASQNKGEFIYVAFKEDGTYISTWTQSPLGKPIPIGQLKNEYFPGNVTINGQPLSTYKTDFDLLNPFTLAWSNPSVDPEDENISQFVRKAMIEETDFSNPDGEDFTLNRWNFTTTVINPLSISPDGIFDIQVYSQDIARRDFVLTYKLQ